MILASGRFVLQTLDLELDGALPIAFGRVYYGDYWYSGAMGYGWNYSYNERLRRLANGHLLLNRCSGKDYEYTNSVGSTYTGPPEIFDTITEEGDGSFTLREPDGTRRFFSAEGTLSRIETLEGDQLLFTYDPGGKLPISGVSEHSHITNPIVTARDYRLTRIEQAAGGMPLGRYMELRYNTAGRITNVVAHSGADLPDREAHYAYDSQGMGLLAEYESPEGDLFPYAYDAERRMNSFYPGTCTCEVHSNEYNAAHRVIRQTAGNQVFEFAYPVTGVVTRMTTRVVDEETAAPLVDRIDHIYFTSSGRTWKRVRQMGSHLDPGGGETDDLVWTTSFQPDTELVLARTIPGGQTTTYTYDAQGQRISETVTNSTGEVITSFYDYGANYRVTNSYLTSSWHPGVKFVHEVDDYDPQGRLLVEKRVGTNGAELVTTYQYQTVGSNEVITVTDPEGHRIVETYNQSGNLIEVADPDNPAHVMRYGYDSRGNRTNRTDALGKQTTYEYDSRGRTIREVNALGFEDLYAYTGNNLVRLELGKTATAPGRTTLYEYDDKNRKIAEYRLDDTGHTNLWKQFGYDSQGNLLYEENALGLRRAYEYDAADRVVVQIDEQGARTTNRYDKAANLVAVIDPYGIETRMDYDLLGRMTNRIEAVGTLLERSTATLHDPAGKPLEVRHPDGSSTTNAYDAFGRKAAVSGTREVAMTWQYDGNDRETVVTDANGHSTTNHYSAYGRLTGRTFAGGASIQSAYDAAGRLLERTDANSNTVHYTYDDLGRRLTESAPNDSNTVLMTYGYDAQGRTIETSNAVGAVTRTFYDRLGRMTNRTYALGLSLTYAYDALDRNVATFWPNGSSTTNRYSGMRLTSSRDRAGRREDYVYGPAGRLLEQTNTLGLATAYQYDDLGRLTVMSNSAGQVTRTEYDLLDRAVRITRPDGLVVSNLFDSVGRLIHQAGAGQYTVSNRYDAVGNRTNLVDGNGNVTTWAYDSRNRVSRKTYADASYVAYSYDANGNQITVRDAKGVSVTNHYDANNLPTRVDYPSDTDVTFAYDLLGRRTNMVDASGTNTWVYDAANRILTNTQGRVGATLSYAYDAEGRRTRMTVHGATTHYAYDTAGRLTSVSNAVGRFLYTWRPDADLVASLTYPGGATVTNTYNTLGQLTSRSNLDSIGGVICSFAYLYDPVGLRTNEVHAGGNSRAYAYDAIGQLTSAVGYLPGGAPDPDYQFTYGYDPVGNHTQVVRNATTDVFSVNNLNQYTQQTTQSGQATTNAFIHDANGSLLSDTSTAATVVYAWNEGNRLAGVSNDTARSEYVYSASGFRVERKEYTNGTLDDVARYLYDGNLPVAELDETNGLAKTFTWGLDLSGTLQRAGGIGGLLADTRHPTPDTPHFFFYDANGNVAALLDTNDTVAARYTYDPFGNLLSATGPGATDNRYRFCTKHAEPNQSLYYYGFRYHRPPTGRWLSRDPRAEREGPNLYAFVHNDPLSNLDAWGRELITFRTQIHLYEFACSLFESEMLCFYGIIGDPEVFTMLNVADDSVSHVASWGTTIGGGLTGPAGGGWETKTMTHKSQTSYREIKCGCPKKGSSKGSKKQTPPTGVLLLHVYLMTEQPQIAINISSGGQISLSPTPQKPTAAYLIYGKFCPKPNENWSLDDGSVFVFNSFDTKEYKVTTPDNGLLWHGPGVGLTWEKPQVGD